MHGLYIQFWPRLHVLHMPITSVPPKKEKTKTKVRRRAGRQWISLPSLVKEKEVPWVPGTVKLSNTKDKKKMNGDQEGRHTSLLHHTLWSASHLVMHHTSLLHHTSSLHHTLLCITPRHCITLLLHSHHRCYKAAMPLLFAFSARHFVPRPERYYVGSCLPPLPHVPSILLPFQHRGYKAAILIGVAATASG